MTQDTTQDNSGAGVRIALDTDRAISAYTITLEGESPTLVGRADFVDGPDGDRIFFHTEVDPEYGGRGLGGMVVREALADSIRRGLTVVPVCPLFATHLKRHGEEFEAEGGRYRQPEAADMDAVKTAIRDARG